MLQTAQRMNTWEAIVDQLKSLPDEPESSVRSGILAELFAHLALLGQEQEIPDLRMRKSHSDELLIWLHQEIRRILDKLPVDPDTDEFYFLREVVKRLPLRVTANTLIEDIRSAAEEFEEARLDSDPLRSFAADLRKETHRRLSPRILHTFVKPYLALVDHGDPEPIKQAGYPLVALKFNRAEEGEMFLRLGHELDHNLSYLWDYENGDIQNLSISMANQIPLFERCFLQHEIHAILELLKPQYLESREVLFDLLKRLVSIQHFLRTSFREGRLHLLDYLLVDLDIGRLVFIFAADLSNRFLAEITAGNLRDSLALLREMLAIIATRGPAVWKLEGVMTELDRLREDPVLNHSHVRRCVQAIVNDVQSYLQTYIISRMGPILNWTFEVYPVPTTRLSPAKTRFFNNLIRSTHFHLLTEFAEKVLSFLDHEMSAQIEESLLYSYRLGQAGQPPQQPENIEEMVACTWESAPAALRPFLGGKGNSLLDMVALGLAVPPAFILGLPLGDRFLSPDEPQEPLFNLLQDWVHKLEKQTGKQLGCPSNPLLVSVRSGAPWSLPGSMLTLLNVGQTREVIDAIASRHGKRFAHSIHARFLRNCLQAMGQKVSPKDNNLSRLRAMVEYHTNSQFLWDPMAQLEQAVRWVFASSRNSVAGELLSHMSPGDRPVTAVTVQQMVFGNRNRDSLSAVLITRNPVTGADEMVGEFREETQGEEVVMGQVVPKPLEKMKPQYLAELRRMKEVLEGFYHRELNLEVTVENGQLWILQARRTNIGTWASLVVNVDFLARGLLTLKDFHHRLDKLRTVHEAVALPRLDDYMYANFNPPIGSGIPIHSGIVTGTLVLSQARLDEAKTRRETVVYMSYNTKPTDFAIMNAAHALVNIYPGRTSHAAIMAMTLNKPCIVGIQNAEIDAPGGRVVFRGQPDVAVREGERITIDANTGAIYRGLAPISPCYVRLHDIASAIEGVSDGAKAAEILQRTLHAHMSDLRRETAFERFAWTHIPHGKLRGKNVLARLDLNVRLEGSVVVDARRIEQAVPIIKGILASKGTPVVLAHLGDPASEGVPGMTREEIYSMYSLKPVAKYLERYFPGLIFFHEASIASSGLLLHKADLVPGKVNLLENLRFASGEKENDEVFARALMSLSDGVFINDAFNVCHRHHASITGIPRFAEISAAGPLVQRELDALRLLLVEPAQPFVAIMGGNKDAVRMGMMESLLMRVDRMIVGGSLACTMLHAAGCSMGRTSVLESVGDICRSLLTRYRHKIIFPRDFRVLREHEVGCSQAAAVKVVPANAVPNDCVCVDVGPGTRQVMEDALRDARSIMWSGSLGRYELGDVAPSTLRLARMLGDYAEGGARVVICGGDTGLAALNAGAVDKYEHASTGGSAFLEFMGRLTLPGIAALDAVSPKDRESGAKGLFC